MLLCVGAGVLSNAMYAVKYMDDFKKYGFDIQAFWSNFRKWKFDFRVFWRFHLRCVWLQFYIGKDKLILR